MTGPARRLAPPPVADHHQVEPEIEVILRFADEDDPQVRRRVVDEIIRLLDEAEEE